uniref:Uncharacterized protein n=1 Tax=Meloidogyne enterolobii TaxID=390850 RepID=A0A6V7WLP5_MELEN|nr:unnamed protein product [Meloidogyne enterolobii]
MRAFILLFLLFFVIKQTLLRISGNSSIQEIPMVMLAEKERKKLVGVLQHQQPPLMKIIFLLLNCPFYFEHLIKLKN